MISIIFPPLVFVCAGATCTMYELKTGVRKRKTEQCQRLIATHTWRTHTHTHTHTHTQPNPHEIQVKNVPFRWNTSLTSAMPRRSSAYIHIWQMHTMYTLFLKHFGKHFTPVLKPFALFLLLLCPLFYCLASAVISIMDLSGKIYVSCLEPLNCRLSSFVPIFRATTAKMGQIKNFSSLFE